MFKPNVIIPACNEEAVLWRTLNTIPNSCNPIVAINGSSDRTADVARSFGAETYEFELPGKDNAFRQTLAKLGKRAYEPFLITDADSIPLTPNAWVESMVDTVLENDYGQSIAVAGLLGYRPSWANYPTSLPTALRTIRMATRQRNLHDEGNYLPCGANAAFKLTDDTLEALLESEERYWPGEDQYYFDLVRDMDGTAIQNPDLQSLVLQSSRYQVPLTTRLIIGKNGSVERARKDYSIRGKSQPGTIPYKSKYSSW
jgi:glycosyltransferase involved in cell wall biosynthesis